MVAFDGVLDAGIGFGYLDTPGNHDFEMDNVTYPGGTESLVYDEDGLLTSMGTFTLMREPAAGMVETVGDGTLLLMDSWATHSCT